jgi:nucleoside phosphorylase
MREMITNTSQYRLAIVTALPKEFAAVEVMLDQHHDIAMSGDPVRYTVGIIGPHPVVVTLLPKMGNNPATAVSSNLLRSFPTISDILMVGIAGGVPDPNNAANHVRLGDIVISMDAGVMQFDLGKLEQVVRKKEPPREHFTIRATDPPPGSFAAKQ